MEDVSENMVTTLIIYTQPSTPYLSGQVLRRSLYWSHDFPNWHTRLISDSTKNIMDYYSSSMATSRLRRHLRALA